jgi:hypothetical protein
MRHMNPEGLKASAMDAGKTALLAVPAAAVVGGLYHLVSKIDYGTEASDAMLTNVQKGQLAVAAASVVIGGALQMYPKLAEFGKAHIAVGVGMPVAMLTMQKLAAAMAPAPQRVAAQPVVAAAPAPTFAAMYYPSGSMIGPSSFLPAAFSPSGALPMYSTQFQSPAFVPGGF